MVLLSLLCKWQPEYEEMIGLTEKNMATLEEIEQDHWVNGCIIMHLYQSINCNI